MTEPLFQGTSVNSTRIIYTPSGFAKENLLHLQEVGKLQAVQPHISSRSGLVSYLFFMVTKGSGKLTFDGTAYDLQEGDCVFLDCRETYSHTPNADDLWSLKWIHFYGGNLPGIYGKYLERGGRPVFHPENTELYSTLLDDLLSIAGNEDYIRDMKINEKITSLLTGIMSESWHPENTIRTGSRKQSLQEVRSFLENHYSEKITLELLAETFFINKFYLTRIFKEQFGMTVLSCLEHIRVTKAKQLLRFSDMTAEEIGREIGIPEPGYFNRVFKKIEGVTPGEYRKMW